MKIWRKWFLFEFEQIFAVTALLEGFGEGFEFFGGDEALAVGGFFDTAEFEAGALFNNPAS